MSRSEKPAIAESTLAGAPAHPGFLLCHKLTDKPITSGLWASTSLSIKGRGYDRPGQLSFGCLLSMPGDSLWPPEFGLQPALTVSGYLRIGLGWILCIIPSWFLGASKAENCDTKWLIEALWTQVSLILIGDVDGNTDIFRKYIWAFCLTRHMEKPIAIIHWLRKSNIRCMIVMIDPRTAPKTWTGQTWSLSSITNDTAEEELNNPTAVFLWWTALGSERCTYEERHS